MIRRLALVALTAALAATAIAQQAPPPAPGGGDPNPAAAPPPPTPPPTGPREGVTPRRVDGAVARDAEAGTKALLDQRPAEAMVRYDQAQVKAPDVAELAYNRGLAALLAGKTDDARRSFELAQKLRDEQSKADPTHAPSQLLDEDSRFNDGHAALQGEDLKGAVQRWASVVQADGSAGDARKNLELALRLLQIQEQQKQQQQQQQQQQNQENQDQQPQPQKPDEGEQQPQPQEPEPKEGEQPQEPEERPGEMTKDQAEQLLDALEAAEKQGMQEKQDEKAKRARPASGKIW